MIIDPEPVILVTGGNGFIGGHVAKRLCDMGYRVRVADIVANGYQKYPERVDVLIGNLCDPTFCAKVIQGADIVLHFAATMGGMGTIHESNDFIIYQENHVMSLNLLDACIHAGVKKFFYASSACVYPESLQDDSNSDISLKESDVYVNGSPRPQGLYGLEKLHTEEMLHQYSSKIAIRIARFHNIYGPGGCWHGGREKAPAALLRKSFAAKLAGASPVELEIWGSGEQRRSFCYIDDALEAIILLLSSDCDVPVNISSEKAVGIDQLANIALQCAEIDPEHALYRHDDSKPVGVRARNSNNDFVMKTLHWSPQITLQEGMRRTGEWIYSEMKKSLRGQDPDQRQIILHDYRRSDVLDLAKDAIVFAILLPITSRGSDSPDACLNHLAVFARSLILTTRDDAQRLGQRFDVRIYLAIDHDDAFLLHADDLEMNKGAITLRNEGITNVSTLVCNEPRGAVCNLWRVLAEKAWKDDCDYFTLMGDDVELQDPNWMSTVHATFEAFGTKEGVPMGFGCVAFTDVTFPGMPTFPVIHRTHMDIFHGEVVPRIFVNQDGDPFLFQLYRRWGCSEMVASRIRNNVGGSDTARYTKQHATDWTFDTLTNATSEAETWLNSRVPDIKRKLTLEIVIPCYRVNLTYLDRFLALKPTATCSIMFIVIVDNPHSPHISDLQHKHGHRPDVRIRVNAVNSGASASRNRGMQESSAEWVQFLDDDVCPEPNLLVEAEKVIRASPNAAGFVGNSFFPSADSVFTAAAHLAGVTFFWDIANKIPTDVPWGVTANLIARRNVKDGVVFDLIFPKTGGGEDIDFCRQKREWSLQHEGEGFYAAPKVVVTHPWWKGGERSYWRFYMWSKGDGALVKMYPEHTYRDAVPNGAESLLLCALVLIIGCTGCLWASHRSLRIILFGLKMATSIVLAHIIHDLYRHLLRNKERTLDMKTSITGYLWVAAVMESTFIRIFSEWGRVVGIIERGEIGMLGRRFDWFTGRWGEGPKVEEVKNNLQRISLSVALFAFFILLDF